MCRYPKLMENPKYKPNKKNGGKVPAISDYRVKYVPIGCGECIDCRKRKANEWRVRLQEDIKTNKGGKFVTLTLSNESIKELEEAIWVENGFEDVKGYELDNRIATLATRRFNERWRKKFKKAPRHWLITELGHNGTENIHLHGIIWGDVEEIRGIWKYGYIYPRPREENKNYVNERTINYIIKYVTKIDTRNKAYKQKIMCSPGIGGNYKNRLEARKNKYNYGGETNETYTLNTGQEIALPIYYRNQIYTDREKEKLWIKKLDKNERYIMGIKFDMNTEEHKFMNQLIIAQQQNERMGYGKGDNWKHKKYEEERRNLLTAKRIENGSKKNN